MNTLQIIIAIASLYLLLQACYTNAYNWIHKLLFKFIPFVLAFLLGLAVFKVIV